MPPLEPAEPEDKTAFEHEVRQTEERRAVDERDSADQAGAAPERIRDCERRDEPDGPARQQCEHERKATVGKIRTRDAEVHRSGKLEQSSEPVGE